MDPAEKKPLIINPDLFPLSYSHFDCAKETRADLISLLFVSSCLAGVAVLLVRCVFMLPRVPRLPCTTSTELIHMMLSLSDS